LQISGTQGRHAYGRLQSFNTQRRDALLLGNGTNAGMLTNNNNINDNGKHRSACP